MAEAEQYYKSLVEKQQEISSLNGIVSLLQWDQTVNMPQGGAEARGKHLSIMSGIIHDKKTSPDLGVILTSLSTADTSKLTGMQKAVIRDARRNYDKSTKIPRDLATRLAELEASGYDTWVKARNASDFAIFKPILKQLVDLNREKAKCLDPSASSPYEVLMDDYERGMTCERLDSVFSEIKKTLIPFIAQIKQKPAPPSDFLKFKFDTKVQAELSHQISKDLGFDTTKGRLDVSVHPFTISVAPSDDVRITTRYSETDLVEGLTGTIHETGHALYEQGIPAEISTLPAGVAVSTGIHESQSLLWERMVGLNEHFWDHYWPSIHSKFPQIPATSSSSDFYRVINTVTPGMIRVEADEVTYPLHIILRYEIEEALINGKLEVDDNLPKLWNQKMQEYLGLTPNNDKEGILQDVHWSAGLFGYFPTYTLGAIYASQLFNAAKKQITGLETQFAEGKFSELKEWLFKNIYSKGSILPGGDLLCQDVTGEVLNPSFFLNYLKEKYSRLYGL